MRFARSLGSRPTDPDYCNAISGPRPNDNHPLYWIAALALPFVAWGVVKALA